MKKPVIAIDGYSSTGKSSISKIIAEKLDKEGEIDLNKLFNSLQSIKLEFKREDDELVLYVNEINVSKEIRMAEVSDHVSLIAKQKEVRDFLLETQRSIARNEGVIMDGRDIGTVVLPTADFKFFLTASIEERTKRRYEELLSLGLLADRNQVKENLIERDRIDSEREISPLKKADDAIEIDNSNLTKSQTIEAILYHLKKINDFY